MHVLFFKSLYSFHPEVCKSTVRDMGEVSCACFSETGSLSVLSVVFEREKLRNLQQLLDFTPGARNMCSFCVEL